MNPFKHRVVRFAFASFIASSTLILTVAPTQATTTCQGATCRGKDPQAQGCAADARTLASNSSNPEIKVELRYSRKCNARWSRVTAVNPSKNMLTAWLGSGVVTMRTEIGHVVWSLMWSGPIKACGSSFDNPGPCTVSR